MSTSVSIIMTPWNRTQLLSNTLDTIFAQRYPNLQIIVVEDNPSEFSTEALCMKHGIEYAKRVRRGTENEWTNPAPLLNKGIQMAKGDILIFQNAECKHENNVIERLVAEVDADPMVSPVPLVQALHPDGSFKRWLMHPTDIERAGWISYFCQAVRREEVWKIQGFDEIFFRYGQEDDMFEFRLRHNGVKFKYVEEALVSHQWHKEYHYTGGEQAGEDVRIAKQQAVLSGAEPNIANYGKVWGVI